MKRKLVVLLATLAIVANAWCQTFEAGGIKYNIVSTSPAKVAVINKSPEYSGSIIIPATIKNESVTYEVTIIEADAFYNCSNLTSIYIPSSVTTIKEFTFYNCSGLISINIPSSITTIGKSAFFGCNGLRSIYIPSSVTAIGKAAFSNCTSLTSIDVDNENPSYISNDGVLYDKQRTIIIQYPANKPDISFEIPSTVMDISDAAFYGCSVLTSISMPSSVTTIGEWAFGSCNGLTSVSIPSSVTVIGSGAFYGCSSLKWVRIPSSVTTIKENAFSSCSSLAMITAESKIPVDLSSASSVFFGLPMNTCVLRIPFGALAAYKAAVKWQDFINIVEIGPVALLATFSNTTLSHINSPIACNSLPKATIYQWLFVTATETVRATSADTIFIPGKAGLKFGTAYTVSIRAMVGDLWSAFGEAYTIRMPAAPSTNLAASYRSATMKDWNSLFRAHYMGGATRYEFVFTDKTTGQVLTYLSKNHAMCFRSLAGAQAGHTYLLKIRPWYGMSEGTFGTSFSITAPK